jgi:hypothetical protein
LSHADHHALRRTNQALHFRLNDILSFPLVWQQQAEARKHSELARLMN